MRELIKNELTGWKKSEVILLLVSCAIITCVSIYWGDSLVGIISAVAGVACVICTGKGKLSTYLFGLINCTLYAYISYKSTYYGETMLNMLYYFPMQFVGFFVWKKNMNTETHEVKKLRMTAKGRVILIASIVASTYLYGLILRSMGDSLPFIDSFTTATSVITLIISIKMYSEQWLIWLVVDAVSVYMWWIDFVEGNGNLATLMMWIVYVILAVVMYIKWEKEASQE